MSTATAADTDREARLFRLRHSCAHVMAQAVLERFPNAKLGIGPPIEDGFYYDFDLPRALTPDDLAAIEKRMRAIVKGDHEFTCRPVDDAEARAMFAGQPYKLEILDDLAAGTADDVGVDAAAGVELTVYTQDTFTDLCRGPHVERTGAIDPDGVKLLRVSGAYWRGDEHRPMLQRIYGTAWESKDELDDYLRRVEEAKLRDHRKIGQDLELFTFSAEVGRGLPIWLPNGTTIRNELERWAKDTETQWGYQQIVTPHITRGELYRISGHLPYYEDDLYAPIDIEGEEYYLRPMNCPHHHMAYKARPRSYRELPIRFAEYGTVYRFERSGQLHGLMRTRGFTQNDAHIYCTMEQAHGEFLDVMRMHEYYYRTLGITDYEILLALRDPNDRSKYHGDDAMWDLAESVTRKVVEDSGIPYREDVGGAAHYGPKLDFIIRSVTGKEFAASTCQLDLYMPARFGLTYVDSSGREEHVAVLHRAPLGSHERFVAFLTEQYFGAFPLWLAPIQARVVPIGDRHLPYAHEVADRLRRTGRRVEVDDSDEQMGKKIRNAEALKVPYMLVVGDREAESQTVAVRTRGRKNLGARPLDEHVAVMQRLVDERSLELA
ncbi:MAG TPA: threonine--tRNA ligase [Actinomycetota bacterium]|nr:threonine--tRNA ligase [Actinomycetota bacterium]